MIKTKFDDDLEMNGFFILMPEEESYQKILKALGLQI